MALADYEWVVVCLRHSDDGVAAEFWAKALSKPSEITAFTIGVFGQNYAGSRRYSRQNVVMAHLARDE